MESCDNCNDKCKYVDECINDMYNALLKCFIDSKATENKDKTNEYERNEDYHNK